MKKLVLSMCLFVFAFSAKAEDNCSSHVGFVDVKSLNISSSIEPATTVQLNGDLLNDLAESKNLNESQSGVLEKVQCIHVVEYETESGKLGSAGERVSELSKQLQSKGWQSFMNMTSDGERIVMLYKKDGNNNIEGFLVIAFESSGSGDSLTFINVVGGFNMADLGNIMQGGMNFEDLGIPGPSSK